LIVREESLSGKRLRLFRANPRLSAKSGSWRSASLLFLYPGVLTKAMSQRLRRQLLMPHAIEI